MSADEIFVLVLVIGCVIAVAAAAVHSRQQRGRPPVEPATVETVPEPPAQRKKQRRRR